MMTNLLESEFRYYLKHQEELVKEYAGQFIVIKNHEVIGNYDNELDAVKESAKEHKLGTYLVQKCEVGDQKYPPSFRCRGLFG